MVFDADARVAAQRGEADYVLILLVEEIGGAREERQAAADGVAAGDVEAGVARVAGEAETEKIAVCARAAEVAREQEAEAVVGGAQRERAGLRRPAEKVVARARRRRDCRRTSNCRRC